MQRTVLPLALLALALAGCSTDEPAAQPSSSPSSTAAADTTTSTPPMTTEEVDLYGVTPDGLTTSVNVPPTVTGTEFDRGCAEAKAAIAAYGDPEIVLALMQATPEDSSENVTVEDSDDPWAEQSPEDQANVIEVVRAAAAGEC